MKIDVFPDNKTIKSAGTGKLHTIILDMSGTVYTMGIYDYIEELNS